MSDDVIREKQQHASNAAHEDRFGMLVDAAGIGDGSGRILSDGARMQTK
jgi:hypothetical protein